MISDRTASITIAVVLTVWTTSTFAGMFGINGYQPSESINGIFMAVVGGALLAKQRGSGGGDHKK